MNDFTFSNPTKIYFGKNQMPHLAEEIKKVSDSVLLVYGGSSIKRNGLYDKIREALQGIDVYELGGIQANPRHTVINQGAAICREHNIKAVLGAGGGSVIDSAKAIAALADSEETDIWNIVEQGMPVTHALKVFCITTMAATGSEMDASAVISNEDKKEKRGIGGNAIRPVASFLNPENTYTVPAYQTACGSFDIMSHTMDTKYFSKDDKMDMLYRMMDEHLKTVVKYAPVALAEPANEEARANLMWAATWALNSFMTCGVRQAASCHSMEHELSAVYDITHGHGLAILTPRWLRYVLNEETAASIARLGTNVFDLSETGDVMQDAKNAIDALEDFAFVKLGLSSHLSDLGIDDSHFEEMAQNAVGKGGVIHGFRDLYKEDVVNIYRMCL